MKTPQELFNIITTHLLTQGKKSLRGWNDEGLNPGQCVYRGKSGTMCAVGCLIPDDAYYPELEGRLARSEPVSHVLKLSGIDVDNPEVGDLLDHMQSIHDSYPADSWERNLEEFATLSGYKFKRNEA